MADVFAEMPADAISAPGNTHFQITPSDSAANNFAQRPRTIYCQAAGNCVIVDGAGTALTYAMTAGQLLPFRGVRVNATGTTGTYYGWY